MIDHIIEHQRSNLWADMGSGKTGAVLTAFHILDMAGSNFFPGLILAPLRVARDVWPAEIRKWDHLDGMRLSPIIGKNPQERAQGLHRKADLYTINYENLPWLIEQWGGNWPYRSVICDESTRLKGFRLRHGTKRAAALASIVRKTNRWINLTGTPSPNGLKDLWGQNWFIDQGKRLGNTWTAFKDRWFDYDQYSMEMSPKKFAEPQIITALKDITLTIQMKDWVDLREPVRIPVYVDLPKPLMQQYRELERKMFLELAKDIEVTALTAAAKSTKCLQFAAGAVYYEGSNWHEVHDEKLRALDSIIEETAGANLVVFYYYRHDAERIKKRFPQARELKTAQDEVDWNAGKIPLLLAHPKSAGHGLNLQFGGHHIVWFNLWWDLEIYLQANERLGPVRQMQAGFDRPVYQYHITTRNTLDDEVLDRLESKRSVQEILMDAMKRRQK